MSRRSAISCRQIDPCCRWYYCHWQRIGKHGSIQTRIWLGHNQLRQDRHLWLRLSETHTFSCSSGSTASQSWYCQQVSLLWQHQPRTSLSFLRLGTILLRTHKTVRTTDALYAGRGSNTGWKSHQGSGHSHSFQLLQQICGQPPLALLATPWCKNTWALLSRRGFSGESSWPCCRPEAADSWAVRDCVRKRRPCSSLGGANT